jgi:hypothetical protein
MPEYAAKLPGRKIENAPALYVDQIASLAARD